MEECLIYWYFEGLIEGNHNMHRIGINIHNKIKTTSKHERPSITIINIPA